jgi:hypothetical protein
VHLLLLKWGRSDGKGYFSEGNNKGRGSAPNKGGSDLDPDRQEFEDLFGSLIDKAETADKRKSR